MTNRLARSISRTGLRGLPLSLVLAVSIVLAGCGSPAAAPPPATGPSTASGSTATTPAAASPVTALASPAASPATAAASSQKANANTASQDQIQQMLEAAGVPNAARWAREVVEYRPYPTNDPSFAKLRQELAKYNPGADVVDKIVSALAL